MASKLPVIPTAQAPIARPSDGAIDPTWYRYLKDLEQVVRDQATLIETLRQAVNETRQNPTTAFTPLDPF